jgi:CDP-diacylglycerol--serine O-phosphatidyltransferase
MIKFISLPNLVSYLSLVMALWAIAVAYKGDNTGVGLLLVASSLADLLDGKFANLFNRTDQEKAFGIQLDSLIDVLTFGLTPVIALRLLQGTHAPALGTWILPNFFYLLAAITRLAYYNVFTSEGKVMVGLPTTLCNPVWSSLLLVPSGLQYSAGVSIGLAVLMLSPVRYPKPKGIGLLVVITTTLLVLTLHFLKV